MDQHAFLVGFVQILTFQIFRIINWIAIVIGILFIITDGIIVVHLSLIFTRNIVIVSVVPILSPIINGILEMTTPTTGICHNTHRMHRFEYHVGLYYFQVFFKFDEEPYVIVLSTQIVIVVVIAIRQMTKTNRDKGMRHEDGIGIHILSEVVTVGLNRLTHIIYFSE